MTVMFKRGFAAPEQYRASGKTGAWTDIYGLSACLYYMLTGIVPQDAVDRLMEDRLSPMTDVDGLSKEQCAGIMKGLSLRIEDRFSSLSLFYESLYGEKMKKGMIFSENNKSERQPEETEDKKRDETLSPSLTETGRMWKQASEKARERRRRSRTGKAVFAISALVLIGGAAAFYIRFAGSGNRPAAGADRVTENRQDTAATAAGTSAAPAGEEKKREPEWEIANYLGLKKKAAAGMVKELKKAGLTIVWKKKYSSQMAKGLVCRQSIKAGKKYKKGDKKKLVLTVSRGTKPADNAAVTPKPTSEPERKKVQKRTSPKVDASLDSILD